MSVEAVLVRPFYPGWIIGGLSPGSGAATLTAPGASPGSTSAGLFATTDVATGDLYAVITTSATAPSVANVIAGNDHLGAPATSSGSVGVTQTGVNSLSLGGLTKDTSGYYGYLVQSSPGGDSNVAETGTFATNTGGTRGPLRLYDFGIRL